MRSIEGSRFDWSKGRETAGEEVVEGSEDGGVETPMEDKMLFPGCDKRDKALEGLFCRRLRRLAGKF